MAQPQPDSSASQSNTAGVPQTASASASAKSETVVNIPGAGEVSALEDDPEYLKYLRCLHANWTDCPTVTITYSNVSYVLHTPKVSHDIVHVPRALMDISLAIPRKIQTFFQSAKTKRSKVTRFNALYKASGSISPSTMTLVLAPPGGGKSMLLKAISGRLHGDANFTGSLNYNGYSAAECKDRGINVNRLCAYVGQSDFTFPTLTVKETLEFAARNAAPDIHLLAQEEEEDKNLKALIDFDEKRAELLLNLLGMKECKDTIVGNDLLRGISGGQKKRVALAEMLLTNARVFCLDEVSTGLDAAVTKYIFAQLKEAIQITKASIVTALLQPTPETYELFDDVILMREGVVVYHGPRKEVGQWLKECVGMPKPHGVDEAQWILDVLSDPITAHHTMIEIQKAQALSGSTSMMSRQITRQKSAAGNAIQEEKMAADSQAPQMQMMSPKLQLADIHNPIRTLPHGISHAHAQYHAQTHEPSMESRKVVFHLNTGEDELREVNHAEEKHVAVPFSEVELQRISAADPSLSMPVAEHVPAPAPLLQASHSLSRLDSSVYAKDDSGVEFMKGYMKSIGSAVYVTPAIDTDTMHFNYKHSQWHVRQTLNSSRKAVESDELDSAHWSEYTLAMFSAKYPHSLLRHTGYNLSRQAKVIARNKTMVRPRLAQALLMGFIFGTLFYQLDVTDYSDRMGLLLYCAMYCAFTNLTELPVAGEAKAVVGKQLDAGFFSPLSYTISVIIVHIPITLLETAVFSLLIYFTPNLTYDGGRFFFFYLILITCSSAMSVMFRAISYVAKNPDVARQLDLPFIIIFIIFGGFLLPYSKISNWCIWLYWISPFSWAVRSLALNEFKASRFDDQNENGQRNGDVYLEAFDVKTDDIWKWMGFVYLVGFFFFWAALCVILLYGVRPVTPLGTRRPATTLKRMRNPNPKNDHVTYTEDGHIIVLEDEHEEDQHHHHHKHHRNSSAPPIVKPQAASGTQHEQQQQQPGSVAAAAPATANEETAAQKKTSAKGGSMPFTPVAISWQNLNYTVFLGKDNHAKQLLNSVNGFALPGEMTALMGASGAGKTTLMDVIAARKTTGKIDGDILINGVKVSDEDFQHLMGYVEQNDIHMGTATVREALEFSAKLRLPTSVSESRREAFIDEVMELVGLTKVAHRLVGDAALPGVSSGQLKLVTIAVELVANPSILFLDEPTSGLDAPAALRVMKAIRNIAATGRTVVCTIHQPSAQLFYMFDRLLLLRSGGRTVYFSKIGKKGRQLVQYFQGLDDNVPLCPHHINPANWMLDVIGAAGASAYDFDFADRWDTSDMGAAAKNELEQTVANGKSSNADALKAGQLTYPRWLDRFYTVQQRMFVSHWRNPPTNATRIMIVMIIGFLFGGFFYNESTTDFTGVQSKLSVLFLGISFPASVCASAALPTLFRQRAVYYREVTSKMYSFDIYAHSLMIVEIPWVAFSLVVYLIPFYFLVGFQSDAGLFFRFGLVVYLMGICYSFLSQLWLALCPNQISGNVLNGFFLSVFFMFGGLFIHEDKIPSGWKWFYYVDPLPKALIPAATTQFYCDGPNCGTITVPGQLGSPTVSDYVHQVVNGNHTEYWTWMGWLLLEVVGFRLITLIALKYISHIKR